MNRNKTLLKNTLIYALGNFLAKFLSLLLLPLYTYYLTPNDYGYYDLLSTTLFLLMPIITLQITDGLYRFMLDSKDIKQKEKIITNALFVILINIIIFSSIYIIVIQYVEIRYNYLVLIQVIFSVINTLWFQIARGLQKNFIFSVAGIITTIVTLFLNIILIVKFNLKFEALIISNIIANLISLIFIELFINVFKYVNLSQIDPNQFSNLIKYSIPLIPNAVCWWFINASDRYFVNYYLGINANGIYSVSNKFATILAVINSIFYLAWQESAITEYNSVDRNKFYTKMFNVFMTLQFTSIIVLLPITKLCVRYFIGVNYGDAYKYIPLLYLSVMFSAFSSFYGTGYLSAKETKGAFYTSVFAAIINISLNIILIPYIGLQGASLSTVIAFLLMWIIRLKQTRRYFTINIDFKKFTFMTLTTIVYVIAYYKNNYFLEILLIAISLIIFVFMNKLFIVKLLRYFKFDNIYTKLFYKFR